MAGPGRTQSLKFALDEYVCERLTGGTDVWLRLVVGPGQSLHYGSPGSVASRRRMPVTDKAVLGEFAQVPGAVGGGLPDQQTRLACGLGSLRHQGFKQGEAHRAVSYTHLTLPTIYSV